MEKRSFEAHRQGRPNYVSRGRYDDWSQSDILNHLKRVAQQIGTKPTKAILWDRINNQGKDEPSPRFIQRRLCSFRGALELIGYPDIHSWGEDDYVDWGVKFIKANNEHLPTASSIDHLSAVHYGPSTGQIIIMFGKLNSYKEVAWKAYLADSKEKRQHNESRLQIIEDELSLGILPRELFDGAESEDDMISRLAKYQVSKELMPHLANPSIIRDCKPAPGRTFIGNLRKRNNAIAAGDIENTALYLGVFDDIWPPDNSYMEKLQVPRSFMERRNVLLSGNLAIKASTIQQKAA